MTLSGSDYFWPTPTRTRGDSNLTSNTGGVSSAGATGLGRVIIMMVKERYNSPLTRKQEVGFLLTNSNELVSFQTHSPLFFVR